ncbi:MAG: hypothetical protein IPI57_15850 [Candidatus Competibacteraceae bacterium]|nr:hypothetical protein [Candidatus Competibacteraceae bacterium]
MTLGELIEILQKSRSIARRADWISSPAFISRVLQLRGLCAKANITIEKMLESAKSALGETFVAYKGGEFEMDNSTDVYLAEYGRLGEEIGPVLLGYMLGNIGKKVTALN